MLRTKCVTPHIQSGIQTANNCSSRQYFLNKLTKTKLSFKQNMLQHVSTLQELQDIVNTNRLVILKVGAAWCPPCQKVQPLYEAEAKIASWRGLVYDIDKSTNRDQDPILQLCKVAKIPTFAVFQVCFVFCCFVVLLFCCEQTV
jgi:thiol-disulfide isomerase/thioredoxin